jgi:hypothetical protein
MKTDALMRVVERLERRLRDEGGDGDNSTGSPWKMKTATLAACYRSLGTLAREGA